MQTVKPTQPLTIPRDVREFYRDEPDAERLYRQMTPAEKGLVASLARPRSFKR